MLRDVQPRALLTCKLFYTPIIYAKSLSVNTFL
nr:MAG TPA: hypothetical protein [Caudoviricetes sp.]